MHYEIGKGDRARKPMRIKPRPPISAAVVERTCKLIRSWPAPLTWKIIVAVIERREKHRWSRQGLAGHEEIAKAFRERKNELREGKKKGKKESLDPTLNLLKRQLKDRVAEIAALKGLLARYEERFIIMIRNAALHGIAQNELEEPLQEIHRQ